jgi:phage tail-like protein
MAEPALIEYYLLEIPNVSERGALAGRFRTLSGLDMSYDVLEYHEGGNNEFVHHLPGRMQYPNLVLSWGLTDSDLLQQWFLQTRAKAQREPVTVTLAISDGTNVVEPRKWTFADAFPVRWSGPSFDAGTSEWSETLEIAHTGLKLV